MCFADLNDKPMPLNVSESSSTDFEKIVDQKNQIESLISDLKKSIKEEQE